MNSTKKSTHHLSHWAELEFYFIFFLLEVVLGSPCIFPLSAAISGVPLALQGANLVISVTKSQVPPHPGAGVKVFPIKSIGIWQ